MKITKKVAEFINEPNISVVFDTYFYYDNEKDQIGFTICDLFERKSTYKRWKKYLKETYNFNLTKENNFTMSVLHELGHHYTIKLFNSEEWNYQATEQALEGIDGEERYFAYYDMPIEKKATEWAIETYNMNPEAMEYWNKKLNKIAKKTAKKKKIKKIAKRRKD